jgi:GNAT superfamily N-acetyltransferase
MSEHTHEHCGCKRPSGLALRAAGPNDSALLSEFVRELAEFEGLLHECAITPEAVAEHLLGPRRCAAAIIAEFDGHPVGFAVYYRTFSTFAARPGIYLEDLYVRPDYRRRGIGRALLTAVAQIAHARHSGRLEWAALKWNHRALDLYKGMGAKPLDEWTVLRMGPEAIASVSGPCEQHKPHAGCGCGGNNHSHTAATAS